MYPEDAVSDVTPIGPAQGSSIDPLATGVAPRDASDLPFGLGQHVLARVLQMLSPESALLEIAGQRFTTSTPVPLVPGQILDVAVRSTGTVVDLELLDPPDVISDRAYALASVMEARHASVAPAPPSLEAIRTLLASLPPVRAGESPATPQASLSARAAAALLPAPLDADGARLVDALRHAVTASGLFFEARLAAALPPEQGRGDLATVADDRRAVLAELAVAERSAASVRRDARCACRRRALEAGRRGLPPRERWRVATRRAGDDRSDAGGSASARAGRPRSSRRRRARSRANASI